VASRQPFLAHLLGAAPAADSADDDEDDDDNDEKAITASKSPSLPATASTLLAAVLSRHPLLFQLTLRAAHDHVRAVNLCLCRQYEGLGYEEAGMLGAPLRAGRGGRVGDSGSGSGSVDGGDEDEEEEDEDYQEEEEEVEPVLVTAVDLARHYAAAARANAPNASSATSSSSSSTSASSTSTPASTPAAPVAPLPLYSHCLITAHHAALAPDAVPLAPLQSSALDSAAVVVHTTTYRDRLPSEVRALREARGQALGEGGAEAEDEGAEVSPQIAVDTAVRVRIVGIPRHTCGCDALHALSPCAVPFSLVALAQHYVQVHAEALEQSGAGTHARGPLQGDRGDEVVVEVDYHEIHRLMWNSMSPMQQCDRMIAHLHQLGCTHAQRVQLYQQHLPLFSWPDFGAELVPALPKKAMVSQDTQTQHVYSEATVQTPVWLMYNFDAMETSHAERHTELTSKSRQHVI
jgi:hypothetical protein